MSRQPPDLLSPKKRPTNGSSSYYEDQDYGSLWLQQFLSFEQERNQAIARSDLELFRDLPLSIVHPHVSKHLSTHLSKQPKIKGNKSPKALNSISNYEKQRISKLIKVLNQKGKAEVQADKRPSLTPYIEANTKISRVLNRMKLKTNAEDMQSSQLNNFYNIVAKETTAAIVIQSQRRRVLAIKCAQLVALQTKIAIKIQSLVRGLFARRLLNSLKEEKRRARLIREKCVRVYIARWSRKRQVRLEQESAVLCQSTIRVYFAKCILNQKRLQYSWGINQLRWRAISTRLAWMDLRMNFYARQIQCIVRRKLAQKRVLSLVILFNRAAVDIQRIWRQFAAQKQKKRIIYELMVETQCNKIRIIVSEERYWKQEVENLAKPIKVQHRQGLEVQKKELETACRERIEQINALEIHFRDQLEMQQQITPRAIEGGWEEQIEINLKDTCDRITETKLDLMFTIQPKRNAVITQLATIISTEEDARRSLEHWRAWHQVEQNRLWDLQRQHDREVEEIEMKHAIVDEQMRWALKHYMPSGKPDKRRTLLFGTLESGERVQQLVDVVKEKADEYQSKQHLECTWKPFQKVWDQFNSLEIESSSGLHAAGSDVRQQESNVRSSTKEQSRHDMSQEGSNDFDNASLYPMKTPFPKKLPFELLQQVRDERTDICTSLKPN
eukprot:scaffold3626_cov189-Alexandrium_tamarense.AAC.2